MGWAFAVCLAVRTRGGRVTSDDGRLRVAAGADEAILGPLRTTSYNGFDRFPATDGKDPVALAAGALESALRKPYDALLAAHLAEYQPLFRRVALDLGSRGGEDLPTDQRIRNYPADQDPALVSLLFHYGLLSARCRKLVCPARMPADLAGHLERHGPAAVEFELHDQHQHPDEPTGPPRPPTWPSATSPLFDPHP